jgi:hypothetical protein
MKSILWALWQRLKVIRVHRSEMGGWYLYTFGYAFHIKRVDKDDHLTR